MLRLVHPPTGGQGSPPSKGRRSYPNSLILTADEARHLRAALKNLRYAYGSWSCLAEVMGVSVAGLGNAISPRHRPSAALALRAAQAAGMSVETLLTGQLTRAGRCPTCGTRVGDHPTLPSREAR